MKKKDIVAVCVSYSIPQLRELQDFTQVQVQHQTFFSKCVFHGSHKPILSREENSRPALYSRDRGIFRKLVEFSKKILGLRHNVLKEVYLYLTKVSILSLPFWVIHDLTLYQWFKTRLTAAKADFLLIAVDTSYYRTCIWVAAAKKLNLRVVLVPFALADITALIGDRVPFRAYRATFLENNLLSFFAREMLTVFQGTGVTLLPFSQAISRKLLNFRTPEPWVYNSSYADLTLFESDFTFSQFSGIYNKLDGRSTVSGRFKHDRLHVILSNRSHLRTQMYKRYNLSAALPTVLAAVTANKFSAFGHQSEFETFDEMINFWLGVLKSHKARYNLLLAPRPGENQEFLRGFEDTNVAITTEPLDNLIPLVELLVNDCSATSRTAAAAGTPVFDYDLYNFALDFNKVDGPYLHVVTKIKFSKLWNEIWEPSAKSLTDYFGSTNEQLRKYYGPVDGKATERIAASLVQQLSQK